MIKTAIFVKDEDYFWMAKLNDGSIIKEYDDEGNYTSFTKVQENKSKLQKFYLVPTNPLNNAIEVPIIDGSELVFFKRRRLPVSIARTSGERETTYIVGLKYNNKYFCLEVKDFIVTFKIYDEI